MKAKEIRIGNYFEYKERIIKFDIADFIEVYHNSEFLELLLKPIELTEEWLIKFGFIYHESFKHWVINWGSNGVEFLRFDENYKMFSFQLGKGKYKVIQYVHQLQNLYFALTGE